MRKLKIVVIGGGSVGWGPAVVRDMLLTPALSEAEFVLLDKDKRASDLIGAFLRKLALDLGVNAIIVSTDRRDALADADYVIITISTGGLDAMEHDLALPAEYSIHHTVGDTSGPGGWARLIRNFKVFVSLAEDINRYAPGAVILNYTNPMTGLTDVLCRLCSRPVVGLCHGLFENLHLLQKLYNLQSQNEIAIRYGGINHFFWATDVRSRSTNILADLTERLQTTGFTELLRSIHHKDEAGFTSNREVATELFHLTGAMPYLGDRHTCEFFSCYITSQENMSKYRLSQTTVAARRKGFFKGRERLVRMIEGEIGPEYKKRTRETAADIIEAHSQGKIFVDVGNLPNVGQISNLPHGLVVETAVQVDSNGFTPLTFGALPPVAQAFIEPYAHVFPMTVDACFEKK